MRWMNCLVNFGLLLPDHEQGNQMIANILTRFHILHPFAFCTESFFVIFTAQSPSSSGKQLTSSSRTPLSKNNDFGAPNVELYCDKTG